MTSTETVAPTDRPAAHVATGVIAVMQHLIDHGLSCPANITPSIHGIRIVTPGHTYRAWADTIVVDTEVHQDRPGDAPGRSLWTARGRLPDTGIRVELTGYACSPVTRTEVA